MGFATRGIQTIERVSRVLGAILIRETFDGFEKEALGMEVPGRPVPSCGCTVDRIGFGGFDDLDGYGAKRVGR